MDLNRVTIIGNVVRDPEQRTLPSGQTVAAFSLATNYSWKDAEGSEQQSVEFHDVQAFGTLGDILAKYVTKGAKLYVEGRLRTHKVEDKRYTDVIADNAIMLGHRGKRQVQTLQEE